MDDISLQHPALSPRYSISLLYIVGKGFANSAEIAVEGGGVEPNSVTATKHGLLYRVLFIVSRVEDGNPKPQGSQPRKQSETANPKSPFFT
jgi:hypothetical protein